MCQFYQRASMILWERAIEEGLHLAPGLGCFFSDTSVAFILQPNFTFGYALKRLVKWKKQLRFKTVIKQTYSTFFFLFTTLQIKRMFTYLPLIEQIVSIYMHESWSLHYQNGTK